MAKHDPFHVNVEKHRGHVSAYPCLCCGRGAQNWALDHRRTGSRDLTMDPNDYIPLCSSCHQSFDRGQHVARLLSMRGA